MSKSESGKTSIHLNRFDQIDYDQLHLLGSLPAHKRVRRMLEARQLVVGLKRGHLRKRFPHLSDVELSLKLIQELERAR